MVVQYLRNVLAFENKFLSFVYGEEIPKREGVEKKLGSEMSGKYELARSDGQELRWSLSRI